MTVRLARDTRWVIGAACALGFGAMLRYPGGTTLDPASHGYSLSRNFLSDLGMTIAYDHQGNRLGAGLFVLSLLILVVGLGRAMIEITGVLARQPASRFWARCASVFGLLACTAFTGVAMTPENRAMDAHVAFTEWAWRMMPAAAALLGAGFLRAAWFRRRIALAWFALSAILAVYAALISAGPTVETPHGLVFQVVAQKIAAVAVIATLLFATSEVARCVQRARANRMTNS